MRRIGVAVRVLLVITLVGLGLGLPAGVQAEGDDDGLVAEWHFDGGSGSVLADSSGNGNDGVIHGATWVEGKYGKALSFDGVDDYVEVPDAPELSGGAKDLTVEAWVKPESASHHVVIAKYRDTSWKDWGINIYNNKLHFQYEYNSNNYDSFYGNSNLNTNVWYHVAFVYSYADKTTILYLNGMNDGTRTLPTDLPDTNTPVQIGRVGGSYGSRSQFKGLIDEIKIYNSALTAEDIQEHYEQGPVGLSITKSAAPHSIKQGQTTTVTLTVKNTGTTEITDIEVADTIPPDLVFVSGETSKTYTSLKPMDSREFQYILQPSDAGTFNLDPATATYADEEGNYHTAESETATITVIPSTDQPPTPHATKNPSTEISTASVQLHGEKTHVVLGEDILLKLSAVNKITKPAMTLQVILIPPSGMSVTSADFVESGAGQYTSTYTIEPGIGRDIEVRIRPNQAGGFVVNGTVIYYFGDDKENAEEHTLSLPITVRAVEKVGAEQTGTPLKSEGTSAPGFAAVVVFIGLLAVYLRRKGI